MQLFSPKKTNTGIRAAGCLKLYTEYGRVGAIYKLESTNNIVIFSPGGETLSNQKISRIYGPVKRPARKALIVSPGSHSSVARRVKHCFVQQQSDCKHSLSDCVLIHNSFDTEKDAYARAPPRFLTPHFPPPRLCLTMLLLLLLQGAT
jgi:hypothetical protein